MTSDSKIQIKITDALDASHAAYWCQKHAHEWKLRFQIGQHNTTYIFEFDDPKEATIFALKWVH